MFGSDILEVAIGLTITYVLLSLICSGLTEWFSALSNRRAMSLDQAIRALLSDPKGSALVKRVYAHPLIRALSPRTLAPKGKGPQPPAVPANIPPRVFAQALLDTLVPLNAANGTREFQDVRNAILGLENQELRQTLLLLLDDSQNDFERASKNIELWFNDSMERLSALYRKRTQEIILVVALVITLLFNVDTFGMINSLWRDSAVRDAMTTQAQAFAERATYANEANLGQRMMIVQQSMQMVPAPIGWDASVPRPTNIQDWLIKVLGWLTTTVAVAQGAPFWFDVLNKLLSMRTTPGEERATVKVST